MQPSPHDNIVSCEHQFNAYQRRAFGTLFDQLCWRIDQLRSSRASKGLAIANKLQLCCRNPLIITVDDGAAYYLAEARCRSRVCPRCSLIRARQLATRIAGLIHRMDDPRFLTLTIRSSDRPLADQVKFLRRRFAAMRRTAEWQQHVVSGVYTIEITFSEQAQQWHPHLHAIIDGRFWSHRGILRLWEHLVKDHAGVDIRAVRGIRKLANYLACYVAKSCDLKSLTGPRLAEWAIETHGLRLAQTFGSLQRCKPQTDDPEPLPHRLVEIDVNDIAYHASCGIALADQLLVLLEPGRPARLAQNPATVAGLICAFNNPYPRPPPPPRERIDRQMHLRSITSN